MAISLKVDEKLLNASPEDLRKFGLLSGAIIAVLFGLLFPWLFNYSIPKWPWVLSTVLVLWGLIHPVSLKVIYNPWLKIGAIMGWINSRIILGFIFYFIITPAGFIVKIAGKKLISGLDGNAESYRETPKKTDKKQMENIY